MTEPGKAKMTAIDRGQLPDLVGYQLRRAQIAVFQHFMSSFGNDGITPGRFGLLIVIQRNAGLSQTALAEAIGVDRSTMVSMIDKLEEQGWVERKRSGQDRRSHAIFLTGSGEEMVTRAWEKVQRHEDGICRNLSADERRQLIELLSRLATS